MNTKLKDLIHTVAVKPVSVDFKVPFTYKSYPVTATLSVAADHDTDAVFDVVVTIKLVGAVGACVSTSFCCPNRCNIFRMINIRISIILASINGIITSNFSSTYWILIVPRQQLI
jgi:hypothetical protein